MIRRAVLIALLVLAALAVVPAGAAAHAILERTSPERGAELDSAPAEIAFFFNEPVEASFGAIRLYDAEGEQVPTGELTRPEGSNEAVGVPIEGSLPDGVYTATYRVISADSHPVSGGMLFTIGEPGGGPARTVSELLEGSDAGSVTSTAFWAARWIGYIATGLAIGAIGFLLLIWGPALARVGNAGEGWAVASEAFATRTRVLLLAAAAAGLASALLTIVLQGAAAAGTSFWDAFDTATIGDVLDTRYGTVAGLRVLAWALLAALILFRAPTKLLALPAVFLAVAPALSGHASTQDPSWLLVPSNVVHVAVMSLWFGGLALLVGVVPVATRLLEPAERTQLLGGLLIRFSPLALGCVLALTATGVIQALIYVDPLSGLTDTAFGRAVLIKVGLLLVVVCLGAVNRQRLLPALRNAAAGGESSGRAGLLFRRTMRAEVALIVVVLGVAAALVSYAPPSEGSEGPVSGSATLGPATLDYTVDPAEAGRNEMHLYLFDAEDGTQYTPKELAVHLELAEKQIGPIEVELQESGPGHYVAPTAPFGVPGDWTVEVEMRISRFEQEQAELEIPIG